MLTKICSRFSQGKKSDFFWTEVSKGVKEAEYAVRGLVPTTAFHIKEDMEKKTKRRLRMM
jgi:hypothetical protein